MSTKGPFPPAESGDTPYDDRVSPGSGRRSGPSLSAAEALTRLGGISSSAQIKLLSSRKRLRTAVARGEVLRIGRDRYALPTTRAGLSEAMALGGHLSHLSAAAHWEWEVWRPPSGVSIIVPTSASGAGRGRARLRTQDLRPHQTDGWATSKLVTVIHCARDLPLPEALAVADSALRHGDVAHEDLVLAAASEPAHVRLVAEWADDRPANPFESALRALAIQAGLPVVPQYETRCGGLLLHPDLADPFRGIAIEAESWGFHADKYTHDRDCARFNALTAAGWVVLRFTWEQVMFSPDYVVATIRAVASLRSALVA